MRCYDIKDLFPSLVFVLGESGIFMINLLDQVAQLESFIARFKYKLLIFKKIIKFLEKKLYLHYFTFRIYILVW